MLFCDAHQFREQILLRDSADDRPRARVDDGLRYAHDPKLVRQLGELSRFHALRADHARVFHRHLVREQHGSRAMRSGGGDEDLQVQGLFQSLKERAGLWTQPRVPPGDEQDVADQ